MYGYAYSSAYCILVARKEMAVQISVVSLDSPGPNLIADFMEKYRLRKGN